MHPRESLICIFFFFFLVAIKPLPRKAIGILTQRTKPQQITQSGAAVMQPHSRWRCATQILEVLILRGSRLGRHWISGHSCGCFSLGGVVLGNTFSTCNWVSKLKFSGRLWHQRTLKAYPEEKLYLKPLLKEWHEPIVTSMIHYRLCESEFINLIKSVILGNRWISILENSQQSSLHVWAL